MGALLLGAAALRLGYGRLPVSVFDGGAYLAAAREHLAGEYLLPATAGFL
jgi:hypothetical protein